MTMIEPKQAGEWTTTIPSEMGFYWWRSSPNDLLEVIKIDNAAVWDGIVLWWSGNESPCLMADIDGEFWSERIAPPEIA